MLAVNRDQAKEYILKGYNLDEIILPYGNTLLMHYCTHGDLELVQFLLDKGANVNISRGIRNGYRITALGFAWIYRKYKCAELLLKYGANPNCAVGRFGTVLDESAALKDVIYLRLLLKYKPDLESINLNGRTPVQEAANCGNFAHFQLLVDAGAETKKLSEWAMEWLRCRRLTKQMARTMFWIVKKRLGRDVAGIVAGMIWSARWMEIYWE